MAQLVARLVRNEKVGGSNPPSSTTDRHPIRMSAFCMPGCVAAARRWCSGRWRACCGAGLLSVPVGGGPPASRPRRELRSARRLEARPGPATAHGHGSLAPIPPASYTPAAPGVLMVFEARPGPATARGHRSLAPHTPASYTPAAPAVLCVLAPVSKPARALRTLRCPPRQWCLAADVWLGASARSSAWSCRWPRAPQPGPTAAHRCGR